MTDPSSRPRAVFMGTPAFAVPSLRALLDVCDVVGVVCQPDKPAGRGMQLQACPVKTHALAHGLDVYQPAKLRDGEAARWLSARRPDVALVVAYGRILPKALLEIPRLGCLNVHGSLLPRHRGAAPIQWAVLSGDAQTGVTLMQMDEGLDTGPMLATRQTPIDPDETSGALFDRLSQLGATLVRETLPQFLAGALTPVPQDAAAHTLAPMLDKGHSPIVWTRSAQQIHDHVRGLQPWPMAETLLRGKRVMVHRTTLHGAPPAAQATPGQVVALDGEVAWVATGDGCVGLCEVQAEGRKRMGVREFAAGAGVKVGVVLGSP